MRNLLDWCLEVAYLWNVIIIDHRPTGINLKIMEINVSIRKITKDWESSALQAMELVEDQLFNDRPDRFLFDDNTIQVHQKKAEDYRPVECIARYIASRERFVTALKKIIEFGAARPLKEKTYKNFYSLGYQQRWATIIDVSKLFREIVIKTDDRNYRLHLGPDLAGLGVVVERSSLFVARDWFRHEEHGNVYKEWEYHYPLEDAPNAEQLGLPDGYAITHHGPEAGETWMDWFEGGSYIRYVGTVKPEDNG